jgi:hypothetical protein
MTPIRFKDGTKIEDETDPKVITLKKRIEKLSNKVMKLEADKQKLQAQKELHTEESIELAVVIRRLREEKKHLKILLRAAEDELVQLKANAKAHIEKHFKEKK